MTRRAAVTVTVLSALVSLVAVAASAQEKFPSRPIELVVPTPAGGGTDITMRVLAEVTEPLLGQKVVVVNKPGGAGTVGVAAVTQARPDGYVLGAVYNAPLTMLPHIQQVPYTPNDYVPVSLSNIAPLVFCTRPDFPASDGKGFIEELKRNPGKYTYGGDGTGGTVHLAAESIFRPLGVQARLIPFQSAGETLQNFLGGHVMIYGGSFPPIITYLKDGRMKCQLVTSSARSPFAPDVASTADVGVPQANLSVWAGLIAPKGIPADRLAILEKAFAEGARTEKYRDFMAGLWTSAVGSTGAEFGQLLAEESAAMKQVVAQLGLAAK
jgi:tripartite-type tricarboxylate transporter receptor subunit TctC